MNTPPTTPTRRSFLSSALAILAGAIAAPFAARAAAKLTISDGLDTLGGLTLIELRKHVNSGRLSKALAEYREGTIAGFSCSFDEDGMMYIEKRLANAPATQRFT